MKKLLILVNSVKEHKLMTKFILRTGIFCTLYFTFITSSFGQVQGQDVVFPTTSIHSTDGVGWASMIGNNLVTGSSFWVYINPGLEAVVAKRSSDGTITTKVIMQGVENNDNHAEFSLGVDNEGYIHVIGGQHNSSPNYYVSKNPDDITSFDFRGNNLSIGGVEGTQITYQSFVRSNKGTLFVYYRSNISNDFVTGARSIALARYDTKTKRWTMIGGRNYQVTNTACQTIGGQTGITAFVWNNSGVGDMRPASGKCISNAHYQGYQLKVKFDQNNGMHITYNMADSINVDYSASDVSRFMTHLFYAYSPDEGNTWFKANGSKITTFPITKASGDLVHKSIPAGYVYPAVTSTQTMFNSSSIILDKDGLPIIIQGDIISNSTLMYKWSGTSWVNQASLTNRTDRFYTDLSKKIIYNFGSSRQFQMSYDNMATFKNNVTMVNPPTWYVVVDEYYLKKTGNVMYYGRDDATNNATIMNMVVSYPEAKSVTAPAGLFSSDIAHNSITINWTPSPEVNVIRYEVYRNGILVGNTGASYYTITGLNPSTSYTFTVKAIDGSGNFSPASTGLTVSTTSLDTENPTAPTNLVASNITTKSFTLSWTASTDNVGVISYEIFRNNVSVGTSSTTSFNLTGLTTATSYLFTVVAKDAVGNISQSSNALNVTTSISDAPINKTNTPIVIDGSRESFYSGNANNILKVTGGSVTNATDLSANWIASYDANNLYFHIDVKDDILSTDSPNWYENDVVEIYLDTKNLKPTSYTANDYQFYVVHGQNRLNESKRSANPMAGTTAIVVNQTGGYQVEVKIPYSTIGMTMPIDLQKIGIDVAVIDRDNGSYGKMHWFNSLDNSWQNPSTFGTGHFSENTDAEKPTAPTNLVASSITTNSFTLNWTISTDNVGVTSYEIFRNNVSVGTTTNPITTFNVTGLTASTSYAFTVVAKDAAGNVSLASNILNVVTLADTQAPTIPAALAASLITHNSLRLTWTASTDNLSVTGYEIFRDNVSIGTSATTIYDATGLSASTTYVFKVRAKDAANNVSGFSTTASATTQAAPDTQAPTVPTSLMSTNITINSFTLSWTASTDNVGVTSYEVFRDGVSIGTTASTSMNVTSLNGATTYSMRVTAKDASNNVSAQSTAFAITTLTPPDTQAPSVPVGLASSSITLNSFTLSWAASTDNVGVTSYEVFRDGVSMGTSTATSMNIAGLIASTTYSMRVIAKDAAGNISAQSSALTVTTLAPPDTQTPTVPISLASNNIIQTSFTLTWTASTDNVGVTSYEVFRDGVSIGTPTATTFNVTGLIASTSYSMTVRARDAAGNFSAQSAPLSVTTKVSFTLPITNFTLTSSGSLCRGSNNGKINITAVQSQNYIATVTSNGNSTSYPFVNNALEISNLSAGVYNICITVTGQAEYKQCYDVTITEPQDLAVLSTVNPSDNTIYLAMQGGTIYSIDLNGKLYTTAKNEITLPLLKGKNTLMVSAERECLGLFEKSIFIVDKVLVYPNPFESNLDINIGNDESTTAQIKINSTDGKVVYVNSFTPSSSNISLDLSGLKAGMYLMKLSLGDTESYHKIIKR